MGRKYERGLLYSREKAKQEPVLGVKSRQIHIRNKTPFLDSKGTWAMEQSPNQRMELKSHSSSRRAGFCAMYALAGGQKLKGNMGCSITAMVHRKLLRDLKAVYTADLNSA